MASFQAVAGDVPAMFRGGAAQAEPSAAPYRALFEELPFRALFEELPFAVIIYRFDGLVMDANPRACAMVATTRDRFVGKYNLLEDPEAIGQGHAASFRRALEGAAVQMPATAYDTSNTGIDRAEDRLLWCETTYFPATNAAGERFVVEASVDVTDRVRTEQMSRAISTPLLPIADRVVLLPLVGDIDRARAQQVMQVLLDGITAQRARVAILDITGVPHAGVEVTGALAQAARAVRLLGAEVVITGVRPAIARALVESGAGLDGVVTRSTLQAGVAYALTR